MIMVRTRTNVIVALVTLVLACSGPGGSDDDAITDTGTEVADGSEEPTLDVAEEDAGPVPAPDFTLTDINPNSPTFGDERSPSREAGKVLIVYFANYT